MKPPKLFYLMSNQPLLLKIAKTHVWARKKQSAIAALGVTFGIGTFITLMSFNDGFEWFVRRVNSE